MATVMPNVLLGLLFNPVQRGKTVGSPEDIIAGIAARSSLDERAGRVEWIAADEKLTIDSNRRNAQ